MRILAVLMATAVLAGCGVDGEPWTPTMSGTIGVGSGGVYTSGAVNVSNGPISITVGGGCSYNGC